MFVTALFFSKTLIIGHSSPITPTSLVAQTVKHLPAMRETWVRSLGLEDPLEGEMATHFSIPAWRITWMEEPGELQSMGLQRVGHEWAISLHFRDLIKLMLYSNVISNLLGKIWFLNASTFICSFLFVGGFSCFQFFEFWFEKCFWTCWKIAPLQFDNTYLTTRLNHIK